MKLTNRQTFIDYLGIAVGSFLIAIGLTVFLIPNKIAAGGVSGLSTVIYYLTGIPVGIMMLIINIPLFIAGVKVLGKSFGTRTIFGMVTLSIFIDILQPVVQSLTHDLILATLYGGAVAGLGMGLVFYSKGTTGGTDMVAKLLNHYTALSVGHGLLLVDGFVVLLAGIFFNVEVALYAALAIFVQSKTIDLIQEGVNYKKAVFIISTFSQDIKDQVITDMERGITVLQGYGGYTGTEKDVLFCIITRFEVMKLKRIVNQIDPDAFVIIYNVHEVLGEGFNENKAN